MLISTAKHKRIVAEKEAEIAGLMKRIERLDGLHRLNVAEALSLRVRLDPFVRTRLRDSRGRFIKDTVA